MFNVQRKMVGESVQHALTGQIDRAQRFGGAIRPTTIDESARTVEVVFTTGQAGERWHWDIGTYIESLEVTTSAIRTARLDKGLSVIGDHDVWNGIDGVFGITEAWRIENGELIGTVRFATDEDSEKVWIKVKDGILRHFSLGYNVYRYEAILNQGDGLDEYRATDWEPTELSIVVASFETTNGIRAAVDAKPADDALHTIEITTDGDDTMNHLKRKLARSLYREPATVHGDPAGVVDPQQQQQQQRAAEPVVTTPVQAPAQQPVQAQASNERALISQFTASARALGLPVEHAVEAFGRGITLQDYNNELIAQAAARSQAQTPGVVLQSDNRADHREQQRGVMADAICARAGIIREITPEIRKHMGASLLDMARHLTGNQDSYGLTKNQIAQRAFMSTSDMPLILENVMNKSLKAGYTETPRTFLDLGQRVSVSDFRAKNTYQIGDAPSLRRLGEHGEYTAGTISESKESYKIDTYQRKIGFTRQMLINDDLNALAMVPRMFGAAGSRLESDIVWGLLLNWDFEKGVAANFAMSDSKHLYDSAHNNLLTGATNSALTKLGLSKMRELGRKMKTLDGNFMNVSWDTLVIPETLETDADSLLAGTILANVTGEVNPFTNKLSYRVEPRLAAVTGGATAWFAFTRMFASFEYAYLDGDEGMYTEVNTQTDIDGLEIKVRKDFGAGFSEYRASAKATGAA